MSGEFYPVWMPKETKGLEERLHKLLDRASSRDSTIPANTIQKREWVMITMVHLLELAETNPAVANIVLTLDEE